MELLENYIQAQTRKIIKEELGISKEVQEETTNLINFINTEILSNQEYYEEYYWERDKPETKVYGVYDLYDYTLFGDFNIQILVKVCIFDDKEKMDEAYKTLNNLELYFFDHAYQRIVVCFPAYRPNFNYGKDILQIGLKNTRIRGTLSHEIKHAYQSYIKRTKNLSQRLNSHKNSIIYRKALEWQHAKNNDMGILGYAVYYCFPSEITANMELLYTTIKQNCTNLNDALEYIKRSQISRDTYRVISLIKSIENNKFPEETLMEFEKYFNRNRTWLLKFLKKGFALLTKCLKRATILSKQYFDNTQPTE